MQSLKLQNDIRYSALSSRAEKPKPWHVFQSTLTLKIRRDEVLAVFDSSDGTREAGRYENWRLDGGIAETYIPRMLESLKELRENFTQYFDKIDASVEGELPSFEPFDQESSLEEFATEEFARKWGEVAQSKQLRQLARWSFKLFNTIFPTTTWLRYTIDSMGVGSMIDIFWTRCPEYVANVPWGLLYCRDPDADGLVDPNFFWGLRFRIDYHAYAVGATDLVLGNKGEANFGHAYYWKGQSGDSCLSEAEWQKGRFQKMGTHVAMPSDIDDPRKQLLQWLTDPLPRPMPVLYFFCKAQPNAHEPFLEFGHDNSNRDRVTIKFTDLPEKKFNDVRFVFLNACGASQKQSGSSHNLLESHFFERGCWAFLGTVAETPIELASKFAIVFFSFFYGHGRQITLPAGEACFQAKRFLWLKHNNIGGLFYHYVNEYELSLSSEQSNGDE